MSAAAKAAWARAEAINPKGLMTVTERPDGHAFIARFTTDEGLRGFMQNLISFPDGSFGIVILPNGTVPTESIARRILAPEMCMEEGIVVTAQLIYSCPAKASLCEQSDMIHADLCRLFDANETTRVACTGVTIKHSASEAETYGNIESDNAPQIQSERISDALKSVYIDSDCDGERLRNALCDLRHFAESRGLDFALWDRTAAQYHAVEQGRGVREATLEKTTEVSAG